ncbi:MAG: nitroreductase family protein [Planctomycetota bacterium]
MDVMKAIGERFSCRAYLEKEVEEAKLKRVLEAARLAPSARNMQDWSFVVVRDRETRRKLSDCAKGQKYVAQAPVVIAAVGTNIEYTMTCGHHTFLIDVTIAVDHLTLAAVEEGLATCWIGAFHEDQVRSLLGIPGTCRVVALLPLGYPAERAPKMKSRMALEEIVRRERWGG